MIEVGKNAKFLGEDSYAWFHGVVEDIQDPKKVGRVRVRCWGYHSPSLEDIPTEHLPWAVVAHPVTDACITGIGTMPHGLVPGSHVIGFFRDGKNAQHPVVTHSIPGFQRDASESDFFANFGRNDRGFKDPSNEYPRLDLLGQPDTNRLARNDDDFVHESQTKKEEEISKDNRIANSSLTWDEKKSTLEGTTYPDNMVSETKAGIIVEKDSSPENTRAGFYHPKHTYAEVHDDGSAVMRTSQDGYVVTGNDAHVAVENDAKINVKNKASIRVQDSFDIEVTEGQMTVNVGNGNLRLVVNGDVNASVCGNMKWSVVGDLIFASGGKTLIQSANGVFIESPAQASINGSQVLLNSGGAFGSDVTATCDTINISGEEG